MLVVHEDRLRSLRRPTGSVSTDPDRDQRSVLLLFFMKQVRYERRTKASKPEDQVMKARMKDMKGCLETPLGPSGGVGLQIWPGCYLQPRRHRC